MRDGEFLTGGQFLVLSIVVAGFGLIRMIRMRRGHLPRLRSYKHHHRVFQTAATELGLTEVVEAREQRNLRIPTIPRLRPTAFRSSQVRSRFAGIIGGEPVELLDWTDNASPSSHQETIVILGHGDTAGEPVAAGSLVAGVPLGSRPKHRSIDEFDDNLSDLNGLYSASDSHVADVIGDGNLPVLVAMAKNTAPFEVRFQPGEMAFLQSLFSLRDAARERPFEVTLEELRSDYRIARDAKFVVETVKRAIAVQTTLSMYTD